MGRTGEKPWRWEAWYPIVSFILGFFLGFVGLVFGDEDSFLDTRICVAAGGFVAGLLVRRNLQSIACGIFGSSVLFYLAYFGVIGLLFEMIEGL